MVPEMKRGELTGKTDHAVRLCYSTNRLFSLCGLAITPRSGVVFSNLGELGVQTRGFLVVIGD